MIDDKKRSEKLAKERSSAANTGSYHAMWKIIAKGRSNQARATVITRLNMFSDVSKTAADLMLKTIRKAPNPQDRCEAACLLLRIKDKDLHDECIRTIRENAIPALEHPLGAEGYDWKSWIRHLDKNDMQKIADSEKVDHSVRYEVVGNHIGEGQRARCIESKPFPPQERCRLAAKLTDKEAQRRIIGENLNAAVKEDKEFCFSFFIDELNEAERFRYTDNLPLSSLERCRLAAALPEGNSIQYEKDLKRFRTDSFIAGLKEQITADRKEYDRMLNEIRKDTVCQILKGLDDPDYACMIWQELKEPDRELTKYLLSEAKNNDDILYALIRADHPQTFSQQEYKYIIFHAKNPKVKDYAISRLDKSNEQLLHELAKEENAARKKLIWEYPGKYGAEFYEYLNLFEIANEFCSGGLTAAQRKDAVQKVIDELEAKDNTERVSDYFNLISRMFRYTMSKGRKDEYRWFSGIRSREYGYHIDLGYRGGCFGHEDRINTYQL